MLTVSKHLSSASTHLLIYVLLSVGVTGFYGMDEV